MIPLLLLHHSHLLNLLLLLVKVRLTIVLLLRWLLLHRPHHRDWAVGPAGLALLRDAHLAPRRLVLPTVTAHDRCGGD